ncbi:MAG TPA: TetR/AcrR family transcriptional regulator [Deltaproteobacteria bacterium]|nr:TetR/AcrR family transcriptional regulator [Deltaproteobacteria bacterium]HPJ93680.1 TetR/AcrR family transcriptional regulator [Deltaproteobacteria bacterium]HPR51467.1 TetR/AcrR family transcriptional regulator [Deltaproteobacteria bacterium]
MRTRLLQRTQPKQQRAKNTVELILKTATELIEEVGFEAFTTKLLAQRANILIRNIYRYYPNKLAIIYALAERISAKQAEFIDNFSSVANPGIPWRDAVGSTINAFMSAALAEPAFLTIRDAMHGSPELKAIDERSADEMTRRLTAAMKSRIPDFQDEKLQLISMIILDTSVAIIDHALMEYHAARNEQKLSETIEELKKILTSYLAQYFE